jgi:3-isopropylmalate/(R)-2-methylmalate dehydratase small subunit
MTDSFTTLTGTAVPLLRNNIDTDAILPSRFLTRINETGKDGFGGFLFGDWRYEKDEKTPKPDFVLNAPYYKDAKILLARDNFGCGSSREHAVWALKGYGIRCVIAPSFGEIFFNNCFKNMVLPLVLDEASIEAMSAQIAEGQREVSVDLEAQTVTAPDGTTHTFEIDAARKEALLKGLDAIGVTLEDWDQIKAWQDADRAKRPWNYLG